MSYSVRLLACALPFAFVAGCFGGEPSEKDARAAWVDAPSGGNGIDNFAEFKLAGCKAASGAPGYQCDVAYRIPGGALLTASGRFFKNGEKWVFEPTRR